MPEEPIAETPKKKIKKKRKSVKSGVKKSRRGEAYSTADDFVTPDS